MANFTVDSAEMDTAVAGTVTSMENVRTEVSTMLARLQELQTTWTGGASSSFQTVVDDWRATQLRVEESMELISSALGTAAQSYATVEQDVSAMFR